jgi:3D (Asp-Asp-Asp) domain-containing protein
MLTRNLNLAAGIAAGCLLASCAEQPRADSAAATNTGMRRMSHVRTTAYTRGESGGRRNALGQSLSGKHCMSAASDWSRFPLGTRFRITGTKDEYIIDDYGTALIGTNTIDLYKPSRLEMKRWGVRHVDIDIVQWGSEEESLKVLGPRKKHRYVRQMVGALQKKKSGTVATR